MRRTALVLSLLLTVACADQAGGDAFLLAKAPAPVTAAVDGWQDVGIEREQDVRRGAGEAVVTPRLIRTGQVSIVVDAYAPFERELTAWLAKAQGHVADANLQHADGQVSWGSLTLRVPAESLDRLVGWVEEKVQVEQLTLSSQDVTAEWVDVQARIDNGKRAETRLQELLATNTGELADVLAVERELTRIRGQIESAEGRMRVLSDQVGLSTLHVQISVRTPYTAAVAPSFLDQVGDTFAGSVQGVARAARSAALGMVALVPWATPGLVMVLCGVGWSRRRRQQRA